MALAPGSTKNSSHAYVCAQYCPLDGEFVSMIAIGDGGADPVLDLGAESVTQQGPAAETKTCERYQWTETLFKTIPMERTDFWVDQSGASPLPFYSSSVIEPFGSKVGTENSSFFQFTPGDVSEFFDIDPDS